MELRLPDNPTEADLVVIEKYLKEAKKKVKAGKKAYQNKTTLITGKLIIYQPTNRVKGDNYSMRYYVGDRKYKVLSLGTNDETTAKEKMIGEAVASSKTEEIPQPGLSVDVTDTQVIQETPPEDKPKRAGRGKGRPRKNQTKNDSSESEKIETNIKADELPVANSNENSSSDSEQPVEDVKTPKKKLARSKKAKVVDEDAVDKVAPSTATVLASDMESKSSAPVVEESEAEKPKRGRGRGRRGSPDATDAMPTPSVTDLRAQLVEDDTGTKTPSSDAEDRPKQRGRGRSKKSDSDEHPVSRATDTE